MVEAFLKWSDQSRTPSAAPEQGKTLHSEVTGIDDSKHVELGRPGNFRALLTLMADNGNDILKKHLERSGKNARYTSKTIQNEMIDTSGIILRGSLIDEVKKCKFSQCLQMRYKTKATMNS